MFGNRVNLEFPVYRLFVQTVYITPYWPQLCLEMVPLFARCSRAPFSFSARCLAVPPVFIQGAQGLTCNAANVNGQIPAVYVTLSPYRPLWNVQTMGRTWKEAWFWGSLQNTPPQSCMTPGGRQQHDVGIEAWDMLLFTAWEHIWNALQANLRCLAVFDQRFQLLAVGFDEFLQHRAVVLHQKFLFGHFHSTF